MKTLILTRHAKSSWDAPGLSDHERPLSGRGRRAAPQIGTWLAAQGFVPDEVLVSDAARAIETWERMAKKFKPQPEVRLTNHLYHAPAVAIREVLRSASAPTVMLIGHNPGISDFASRIVDMPPDHPRFDDYPTAATTVITFEISDWADISFGMGTVSEFVIPHDLPGD